jgi:hypothetical protein
MKKSWYVFFYLLCAFVLGSFAACTHHEERQKPTRRTALKQQKTINTEIVIDNKFTQIITNLCDEIEFNELKYTSKNTKIIPLDIHTATDCFLFASEVNCGFPAGSCGDGIQVIMKGPGGYHPVFEACGYVYNSLSEINHGIKSFVYGTADGYKIKVAWNGKRFWEQIISINGLNYSNIKEIAKITSMMETDFVPEDPKNDDIKRTRVRVETVDIGREKSLKLYTVFLSDESQYFLFDGETNSGNARLLLHTQRVTAIQSLPDFAKDYPDLLITTDPDHTGKPQSHTWRYDRHQKIYVPAKP